MYTRGSQAVGENATTMKFSCPHSALHLKMQKAPVETKVHSHDLNNG